MPTYKTKFWRQVTEDRSLDTDFARHLREIARPKQIAFAKLMTQTGGWPVGIELKAPSRDAWVTILPEPVPTGAKESWRVLNFDGHGFSGHNQHADPITALEDVIGAGFTQIDAGALDKLSGTPTWKLGQQRQKVRDLHIRGDIDYRTMCERMTAILA